MTRETKGTRQHILDTGYRLIASKGFSGVGLAEILQSAGVPKGSFYYYFKSKEQFGEEVIANYFKEYLAALEQIFQQQRGPAYSRLMKYWQRWIETQTDECGEQKCLVVKLSAEVSDLSEPMRLALLNGSARIIDSIAQCIEEGIVDGSIAKMHPGTVAELLYNMWLGATLMSKLQHNADSLLQAMQTTQSILSSKTVA